MSAPDTRPAAKLVPMTMEQAVALTWMLADADMRGVNAADKTRPLGELLNGFDSAPDAVETVRRVIEPVLRPPFLALGVAISVAAALGCVSARETNEKPA